MSGKEQHSWLQQRRMEQLQVIEADELKRLMERMTTPGRLPRRSLHFRKHGLSLGASTEEEYERLFHDHIRRNDLRRLTYIRHQDDDVVWYLIAPDSGAIAMYNETRDIHWSFFHNSNVQKFLANVRGEWVEVVAVGGDWQIQPW